MRVRVRRAGEEDAVAIAPLLTQLGYPVTPQGVAARFARVSASETDVGWVAVDEAGRIVGFASGHLSWRFELDAPVTELTALVVDEGVRRSGAGRALVAEFEVWSQAAGAARYSLGTAFSRTDAHAFYESLGYEQRARKYEKNR